MRRSRLTRGCGSKAASRATLRAVSPNASSVRVGDQVTFTATAGDAGSGHAGGYTWDFGDTVTRVDGARSAHTYTQPGTYTATVSAADAAGNIGSAAATVTVAPHGGSAGNPATRALAATVGYRYTAKRRWTRFATLQVNRAPAGATVVATCRGSSCPVRRAVYKARRNSPVVIRAYRGRRLKPGTVLDVRTTLAGFAGVRTTLTTRSNRPPRAIPGCLAPATDAPVAC